MIAVPSTDSGAGSVEVTQKAVKEGKDQVGCDDGEIDMPPRETGGRPTRWIVWIVAITPSLAPRPRAVAGAGSRYNLASVEETGFAESNISMRSLGVSGGWSLGKASMCLSWRIVDNRFWLWLGSVPGCSGAQFQYAHSRRRGRLASISRWISRRRWSDSTDV